MLEKWNKNTTTLKIKEYENQIAKIENDLDKCFNMFFEADSTELKNRLNEKSKSLEIEKTDILEEIKKLKLVQIITHTKEEVKNLLAEYLEGNINDKNYQRKIINKFVNRIFIFDNKIAIYYNLFNLRNFTYEEALENIQENEVLISKGMLRQNLKPLNIVVFSFTFNEIYNIL